MNSRNIQAIKIQYISLVRNKKILINLKNKNILYIYLNKLIDSFLKNHINSLDYFCNHINYRNILLEV